MTDTEMEHILPFLQRGHVSDVYASSNKNGTFRGFYLVITGFIGPAQGGCPLHLLRTGLT